MLAKEEPHDATGWSSVLLSPESGTAIPMAEAPDPLFSSIALGDGAVILPTGGAICAPASGVVSMLAETKHAFLLDTDDGIEVLIHIGVDTVELGGTPFLAHVKQYDRVEAGQLLIEADLAAIEAAGKPTDIMVIITNTDSCSSIEAALGPVKAGEKLIAIAKDATATRA